MNNAQFRAWLESHDACQQALDWLGDRDAATAWAECPQADWLMWWAGEAGATAPRALLADIVRAALDWVRPTSKSSPSWPKVEAAIVSVINSLEGRGDLEAASAAASAAAAWAAAWAASAAAEAAWATRAAEAAAWAASAAAEAAWAAWAARATRAAEAAAWAASAAAEAARAARATRAAEAAAWAAWAAGAAAEAAASTELANLVRRHMPMPAMEES